jgi:SPX domain protein involved in polyphosphate accumulation
MVLYALKLLILFFLFFPPEKMAEATRKFAALQNELRISLVENKSSNKSSLRQKTAGRQNVPARKIQELKLAFSEFYLSLILLQNYQNLNFTGFRKILKKHDKVSLLNLNF